MMPAGEEGSYLTLRSTAQQPAVDNHLQRATRQSHKEPVSGMVSQTGAAEGEEGWDCIRV